MTPRRQSQLWLLLCMTALCSLIQVPYAGTQYILYFAPIAILTLLALVSTRPAGVGARAAIVAGFFLFYGVASVDPGHAGASGMLPARRWASVPLPVARTGLMSSPVLADTYTRVVGLLRLHSGRSRFTYAAPDCPEVYYLSQLRNPTRTLFDFLDEPTGHDARVLRAIDSVGVTAIALNATPIFSRPVDSTLATGLRSRFPDSTVVANFVVRWRPGG
jgi:hypothetical protein